MTSISGREVPAPFVERLLALQAPDQQTALLRAENLANAEGLERLLDFAERLWKSDPGEAHRLALLCARTAEDVGAEAAGARSAYIRLRTHSANGEFYAALRMAKDAHDGYVACGENLEALRTKIGLMAVLLELGRYREALDEGRIVLDALDGKGDFEVSPTPPQAELLRALVHQNRGGCLEYMGRYQEALDAYALAEEGYRSLDETERLGEILDNRGAVMLSLGRGTEALAAHEAAAAVFADAELTVPHAKALSNIGEANRQLSNYRRSLAAFEQARRLYGSLDARADKSLLMLDTANAYLDLNLHAEALAAYRKANALLSDTGMVHDRARALWGMGAALIARSELGEAEETLAEATELFAAAENAPLLSSVMLEQAALQETCGDPESAVATASRALDLVLHTEWSVQSVYAHLRLADLLLPDTVEAEQHLLAARRLVEQLALPHLRYRLNERLGRLRRLQGSTEEARALLEAAINQIERLRGTVAHETMRASFLADKTAAYAELLELHLAADHARRAFIVAERAKSRALVDLVTGVARGPAPSESEASEERIRTLQSDLSATYNLLLSDTDEGELVGPLPDLHGRAVDLEGEISQLRLRAAGAASDPFASFAPADVSDDLPSDVALVAYHILGDEIVAFVGAKDGIRAVRDCGSASTVARLLQQLEVQWDRLEAGREFVTRHEALLERLAQQVLASLYRELVAPLEPLLRERAGHASGEGALKIAIVPHDLLHQVPFHGLHDGTSYLLERFEISYAPSAKIYSLCQKQASRGPHKALALGVADPSIPAVANEAEVVARHFPHAEVLSDGRATVQALREKAPGCGVVHLACHGMFRADNPMFSSLKLHDGWLTAADVLQMDLRGALVVLSACESARNEVLAGDELIGLARGFIGAGAATLVASLWLAQDETTAWLMEKYYDLLGDGVGRAAALRSAQLALKERYPHPYYWAPFVLIGKR